MPYTISHPSRLKVLHELFHEQVTKTPNEIAVVDVNGSLTYAELNHRVLMLAEVMRFNGVGPDKTVALFMPPCIENVVALMAVLSAGGCFAVIEMAYPPKLVADVCRDADPVMVMTTSEHSHKCQSGRKIFLMDGGLSRLEVALEEIGADPNEHCLA